MKKKIFVVFIVIISIFVLIEIFLRIFANQRLTIWERESVVPDRITGYRYTPNYSGIKRNVAFTNPYKTNSIGFLSDEFRIVKPKDVFRIIILGDSDDAGLETNGPNKYTKLLQNYFSDSKVEIMNWSIGGQNRSFKNINLIKRVCIKYKPDLVLLRGDFPISDNADYKTTYKGYVIWHYQYNESLEATKNFIDENLMVFSFKNFLLKNSYIYRYIGKYCLDNNGDLSKILLSYCFNEDKVHLEAYMRKKIIAIGTKSPPTRFFSEKESIEMYLNLKKKLDSINCSLALFNIYYEGNSFKNYLFGKNDIKFLPLDIKWKPEYSFGKLDGHSNQMGHKLIADIFYKKLYDSQVVPKKYFINSIVEKQDMDANITQKKDTSKSSNFDFTILPSSKLKLNDDNTFKIVYVSNNKADQRFISLTNDMFLNDKKIEISYHLIPKNVEGRNVIDFIKVVDSIFSKELPDVIVTKMPKKIVQKSIDEFYELVSSYNTLLREKKSSLVFLNIVKTQDNSILKYMSNTSGLEHIILKRDYPDWLIEIEGEKSIAYSDHKLNANYLYNELLKNHIPDSYVNPIKNIAKEKKVSVSSDYDSWDWGKDYLTDGIIYNWRFSRGWCSDFDNIADNEQSWIIIDLGIKSQIDKIKIHPVNNLGEEGNGFPKNFIISLSQDGINWNKIHEESNYNPLSKEMPYLLNTDQTAVFFKLETTGKAEKFVGFTEIEIYGTNL